jgi:hypothetical protein
VCALRSVRHTHEWVICTSPGTWALIDGTRLIGVDVLQGDVQRVPFATSPRLYTAG